MQISSQRAQLMGLIEWITTAGHSTQIMLQISPDCLCSCSATNHNVGSFQTLSFKQKKKTFSFFFSSVRPRPRCRLRTIGPHHRRLAATCVCAHEWVYVYPQIFVLCDIRLFIYY